MKVILQDNSHFVLRFDKGEEVIEGLQKFMAEQSIGACVFNGIGACSEVELGYYNGHMKDYRKKPFFEEMEIISFIGNSSLKENKPVVHAHGMFGHTDFTVVGGHVFKVVVSATCEISLTKLEGELKREANAELNLNLLV